MRVSHVRRRCVRPLRSSPVETWSASYPHIKVATLMCQDSLVAVSSGKEPSIFHALCFTLIVREALIHNVQCRNAIRVGSRRASPKSSIPKTWPSSIGKSCRIQGSAYNRFHSAHPTFPRRRSQCDPLPQHEHMIFFDCSAHSGALHSRTGYANP